MCTATIRPLGYLGGYYAALPRGTVHGAKRATPDALAQIQVTERNEIIREDGVVGLRGGLAVGVD